MSSGPVFGVYDCLDDASADIAGFEERLPAEHAAWHALAHARKEYGHACATPAGSGAMTFHLGIVARDLATVRQMLARDGGTLDAL